MALKTTISTYLLLGLTLYTLSVEAHEYWLDPIDSSIIQGTSAIVDIRNGQNFSGAAFPYDISNYQSISISNADGREPYVGRLGDYPAIHPELDVDGLHSINVDTEPKLLIYESWKKFNTFLAYHDLSKLAQAHLDRDLPKTNIRESYVRSAKTLVQVNDSGVLTISKATPDSSGNHQALAQTNSKFEMILLNDPYTDSRTVQSKLLFDGKPLTGRQVELFWKGTQLIRLTTKTDSNGIASFKTLGSGDYLLNAVQLVEPENEDVHWLSYWASITFER